MGDMPSNKDKVCLRYGLNHVDPQFYTTMSVIKARFWDSANAVIAISKELYSQAEMFSRQTVKTSKKFVQKTYQLLCSALSTQRSEPTNVGEQYTKKEMMLIDAHFKVFGFRGKFSEL